MPVRSLQYLAAAREEVLEAFDWYYARSSHAAQRFLAELERGASLIAESPEIWPVFEGDVRRYVLHGFPFSILYRAMTDTLQIVAVAHHKRRPGYWRSRPDA